MRLVPVELLKVREADCDTRRGQLPPNYDLTLLDDPLAGQALKFYLLLTEMPDLIADQGFSAEELFWSRYYWFMRYALLTQAVAGRDAGLEQQAFQMLEHPYPDCTPDWSVIGQVEAAAERDAAAQLRAADHRLPRDPTDRVMEGVRGR